MVTRRGFLGAMLAAAAAPAIIRSASLMPLYVPPLVLWGDGIADDTEAMQGYIAGRRVLRPDGTLFAGVFSGVFRLTDTVYVGPGQRIDVRDAILDGHGLPPGRSLLHLSSGAGRLDSVDFRLDRPFAAHTYRNGGRGGI